MFKSNLLLLCMYVWDMCVDRTYPTACVCYGMYVKIRILESILSFHGGICTSHSWCQAFLAVISKSSCRSKQFFFLIWNVYHPADLYRIRFCQFYWKQMENLLFHRCRYFKGNWASILPHIMVRFRGWPECIQGSTVTLSSSGQLN